MANAPLGANFKGYLSLDPIIDETDILITDWCTPLPVLQGDTLEIIEFALAPEEPGNYLLIFIVNDEQIITEIQYFNNTSNPVPILIEPDYNGIAIVDETMFLQGENVPIHGSSLDMDGAKIPNVELEVYVSDGVFRREIMVTTDGQGDFTTEFEPLPNEGGHYFVGASYPQINSNEIQDEFDLIGVTINNNEDILWEFLQGDTLTGTIPVTNKSAMPLTNIAVSYTHLTLPTILLV